MTYLRSLNSVLVFCFRYIYILIDFEVLSMFLKIQWSFYLFRFRAVCSSSILFVSPGTRAHFSNDLQRLWSLQVPVASAWVRCVTVRCVTFLNTREAHRSTVETSFCWMLLITTVTMQTRNYFRLYISSQNLFKSNSAGIFAKYSVS